MKLHSVQTLWGQNDGIRTVLSAVVIVAGLWLSGEVGQAGTESNAFEATGDIVGVWTWVAESPAGDVRSDEPVASFFEFRQAETGLAARVVYRTTSHSTIDDVTCLKFDQGELFLETAGGTEFRGLLRDDGRTIVGTIVLDGMKSAASLERVATRKRPQVMVPLRDA